MDRKMTVDEWAEIEKRMNGNTRTRTYDFNTCFTCGRVIHENGWSGRDGNLKRHMRSHDKDKDKDKDES